MPYLYRMRRADPLRFTKNLTTNARFYASTEPWLRAGDALFAPCQRRGADNPILTTSPRYIRCRNTLAAIDVTRKGVEPIIAFSSYDDMVTCIADLISYVPDLVAITYNMEPAMTPAVEMADPVPYIQAAAALVKGYGLSFSVGTTITYRNAWEAAGYMPDILLETDRWGFQMQQIVARNGIMYGINEAYRLYRHYKEDITNGDLPLYQFQLVYGRNVLREYMLFFGAIDPICDIAVSFDLGLASNTIETATVMGRTAQPVPLDLSTGLSAAWSFNGNADDAHINGFDLTESAVAYVDGVIDQAIQLTGGGYASITNQAELQAADSFTIQAWVKLTDKTASSAIVSKWAYGTTGEYYLSYDQATDKFRFSVVGAGGTSSVWATNLGSPDVDTWYCLFAWRDSVTGGQFIAVGDGQPNSVASTTPQQTSVGFFLGRHATGNAPAEADVDIVNFWQGRVLDAQERAWLYNDDAGTEYPFTYLPAP